MLKFNSFDDSIIVLPQIAQIFTDKIVVQFEVYTLAYSPISVKICAICGKLYLLFFFYFEKWLLCLA